MVSPAGQLGLIWERKADTPNVHFTCSTESTGYVLYTEYCAISVLCQQ